MKCIPSFVSSEISVFNKNFFSNRSLLHSIIYFSKTTLPRFGSEKFSYDKLLWSNSGIALRKENLVNQIKNSLQ